MGQVNETAACLVTLALMLTAGIAGLALGGKAENARMKQQSVEAGVARWTVDAKTGETGFEYIKGESP